MVLATQFTSGGNSDGGMNTAFFVIVVLLIAGFVLYRLVAPLFTLVLGALEAIAALSLRAGLYLLGAGAVALVVAFGYVMFAT